MRTCHQCFAHCFGGLLGPHLNTLDRFASLSIHLTGFLHVGLICFIFFPFYFFRRCSQSLCCRRAAPARAGGQTWSCEQEALAAGPGCLGLRFLSVKPRAAQQMRQRWQRHRRLPRAAIVSPTVFSAPCCVPCSPCACLEPRPPSKPLLWTPERKEQGLFSSTESMT